MVTRVIIWIKYSYDVTYDIRLRDSGRILFLRNGL